MNFVNFHVETDSDGIALLTWDMPGRSMNVITPEVIGESKLVAIMSRRRLRSRAA